MPVDLGAVTTWDEALEAFPCPECSTDLGCRWAEHSPGKVEAGHDIHDGPLYRSCLTCQFAPVSGPRRPRRRAVTEREIDRAIRVRFPVRFVWEWEQDRAVVRDRTDGTAVWTGGEDDNGFDAERVIDGLNRSWWAQLAGSPG